MTDPDRGVVHFEYSAFDVLLGHQVFDDDPLSACLERCYRHLAAVVSGRSPVCPAGMSLEFNLDVVGLLHEAKCHVADAGPSQPAPLDMPWPATRAA